MATRARRAPAGKPRRTLLLLLLLIVAIFAGIGASSAWGSPKGQWTPKLGLDLEGGRQIVLEPVLQVKGQQINSGEVNNAVDIIRKRVDGSGVAEAEVTTLGSNNIVVSLPGNPSKAVLDSLAQSSQLAFRAVLQTTQITTAPTPTPSTPAPTLPMPITPPASSAPSSSSASPSKSASPSSSASPGSTASSTSGANAPYPQAFPATVKTTVKTTAAAASTKPKNASDIAWASQPVDPFWITNGVAKKGDTYTTLFNAFQCTGPSATKWRELSAKAPLSQPDVSCDPTDGVKILMGPSEVNGSEITDATYGEVTNQQGVSTGEIAVNLKFNGKGSSEFSKVTTRLAGLQGDLNKFAITVDGQAISAPGTRQPITNGEAQISGGFTNSSAKTLANQLKFGALPVSFKELTSDQISPQLGTDQLQKGLLAGAIGLALVVVYSLFQYRALGFVTVASLVVASIVTYGMVTFLGFANGFRLSMAGVTGLIVAIGITADSFIVYFERVRDEVRSGRPLRAAVETGWQRARRTIIISDAVNFLASAVLYILSDSTVKAFAFTLGLTTVIDLVVVSMFTHPTLTLLARTKFFGGGHKWSGFDPDRLGARGVTYAGRGRVTVADRKTAAAAGGQL